MTHPAKTDLTERATMEVSEHTTPSAGRKCVGLGMRGARRRLVLVTSAVLFAMGYYAYSGTEEAGITKGPCLLRVCQDRVALMWETDTEGTWSVSCQAEGKPDIHRNSMGDKVSFADSWLGHETMAYIHKVWLEGLEPGRRYRYRIVGPEVQSQAYEFRTVPAQTDEVQFVVYGDTRKNPRIHRRLIKQMMKYPLDFVVNVGDLVADGEQYQLWSPQFFEPVKGLAEGVPIYIAKGNHEGNEGTYERLLLPPGEESDFGFDYGPLHFFCADNVSRPADGESLVRAIARDAHASNATWKFVTYHVPSVNFGGHWSNWQQEKALPVFAETGIDFVIAGHSHLYERFRPVKPPGQGQYVTYITSGGGGARLYGIEPTVCHAFAKSTYQFCLFHIKGDTLTMDSIGVNGQVIDHVEITKDNGQLAEPYIRTAISMEDIRLQSTRHNGQTSALSDESEE